MSAAEIARGLTLPIRQQDGSTVTLVAADNKSNRLFKEWLFHNDRPTGSAILKGQADGE